MGVAAPAAKGVAADCRLSHSAIMELDHVFVLTAPDAPECAGLGLTENCRRRHDGQGTANLCYCFDNAYLEMLWPVDAAELAAPEVSRTRLADRARWSRNGASPFGIGLRGGDLPFPTWRYRPACLPEGTDIAVATASDDARQPLLFRSPSAARPDAWTDGRAGARQAASGLREIVALHLDLPAEVTPAPALLHLAERRLLTLGHGEAHRMVLTLSTARGGTRRLSLPDCAWLD